MVLRGREGVENLTQNVTMSYNLQDKYLLLISIQYGQCYGFKTYGGGGGQNGIKI
jgi:hypothetical protein